jgi:hypothetical protein
MRAQAPALRAAAPLAARFAAHAPLPPCRSAPRRCGLRCARGRGSAVCAAGGEGPALRLKLAALETERTAVEASALAALAAARDAGAAADAAKAAAEAAVLAGDDAAASVALAARRTHRAALATAFAKAEAAGALRSKLAELCSSLETDIIAAEAAARPPPPQPARKAPRPVSELSDDDLSERFAMLESASPTAGSLEVLLRREMRARNAADGLDGGA